MKISSVRTGKIVPNGKDLFSVLDKHIKHFQEKSILAITSKIISICEGRIAKIGDVDKKKLIKQEAEYFLPLENDKYDIVLTIKNNVLIPNAGIDESNGNGYYVLWPSNSQKTANGVRKYLSDRFSLKNIGVIVTDSKTDPLRMGTAGVCIAHSGFLALNNYIGRPDIFGRKLKVTKANIIDALASAAVVVMGEGSEQTPFAIIEDIPFVKFQERNPSKAELDDLKIGLEDDLYAPMLKGVKWKKS